MHHIHRCSSIAPLLLLTVLSVVTASDYLLKRDDHTVDTAPMVLEITDATLSAAMTGCGLCQQTGLCDHAFKGTPGQFCVTLASGLPCCCPQDAQCVANAYSCRCRRSSLSSPNGHPVKVTTSTTSSDGAKSFSLVSLIGMLFCACCCIRCCCCKRQDPQNDYVQYPYSASAQYGATDQTPTKYPYEYASAPPADPYNTPYATPYIPPNADSGSHGNTYAAGALGAVAGLAGGMLIGSSFGGGGNREEMTTTTTYFDGDTGFGNATSSYDFAGDTGDYGGDSGDFAGDS